MKRTNERQRKVVNHKCHYVTHVRDGERIMERGYHKIVNNLKLDIMCTSKVCEKNATSCGFGDESLQEGFKHFSHYANPNKMGTLCPSLLSYVHALLEEPL